MADLTVREHEILKFLGQALTNKEIAQAIGVSPETVKSHLQRIYAKLGVSNRTEAMRLFYSSQRD